MLLSMVSVFSTLTGALVGAAVGAAVAASVGADVASGPAGASVAGAAVGAAEPHAVRITSVSEIKIIRGLCFDLYISSFSNKVVLKFLKICYQLDVKRKDLQAIGKAVFRFYRINIERRAWRVQTYVPSLLN